MGGKHLKKLRAEKSKVKLKKKQTLPKGQNITDTSFKVKKIVTLEQLKKVDENEPVSSWNLPLKDLLVRLNHYNYNSRLNGLNGIKELLTNYTDVLTGPSMRSIVTQVLDLLTDPEHKVRVTAISLLNFIFSVLPQGSVVPFHDILSVHLSCAMTHRNMGVQQDSLKFIDVMMEYASETMKRNVSTLIQNFIRISESYRYGSHSEVFLSKGSKYDLEKSRSEMFNRFYHILVVAYSGLKDQENGNKLSIDSGRGGFSLRGLNNQYKKIPSIPHLFKSFRTGENVLNTFDLSEFQSQVSIIMTLLTDTWAEFSPNQQTNGFISEYVISEGVAQLLHIILKIFLLLYEKVITIGDPHLEAWFISEYNVPFKKSFMTSFPYLPPVSSKKSNLGVSNESECSLSTTYIEQNLILIYLFYRLKIKCKNEQELKIEKYVSSALFTTNPTVIDILSKVVEVILDSRRNKKSDGIITTVVKAYSSTSSPELKRRLFKILAKIVLEDEYGACLGNQTLTKWMKSLPDRLQNSRIPLYLIETVLKIIGRPVGSEVLKEIEGRAADILSNLPNVNVEGIDQTEGQKLVTNLLYWCKNEVLEDVIKKGILQKASYPQDLKSYVIEIFSYKLTGESNFS